MDKIAFLLKTSLSQEEIEICLRECILEGRVLLERSAPSNRETLKLFYDDVAKWHRENVILIKKAFGNQAIEGGYPWKNFDFQWNSFLFGINSVDAKIRTSIGQSVEWVESLRNWLFENPLGDPVKPIPDPVKPVPDPVEPVPDPVEPVSTSQESVRERGNSSVFLVHGHDDAAREMLARFLEKLGLDAVVLREEVNQGRTLIEKFEASAKVDFAIAVLTPDDEVKPKIRGKASIKRARQNVIFELGYFFGFLGRGRVAGLYREGVELPTDLGGIAYIQLDPAGSWKLQLARELKAAGLDVDLNLVI